MPKREVTAGQGDLKRVFISYRRGDTLRLARLLHHELERSIGGDRVFLDHEDVEAGTDFVVQIDQVMATAGVVLALVGPRWLSLLNERLGPTRRRVRDYLFHELKRALASGIPVVPILVDEASMPEPTDLPSDLAPLSRRHALELSDRFFDSQVQQVVSAVRRHLNLPEPDRAGRSPRNRQLLDAASTGNATRVKALLGEGVPVDIVDDEGRTPLLLASRASHAHVVRLLLDHGADVATVDDDGGTPLIAAVANKASPMVVKILLEHGSEVDARTNDGSTALLLAADRGDPDHVALLLDHGANPTAINEQGVAPLTRALFINNEERKMQVLTFLSEAAKKWPTEARRKRR